MLVDTRVDAAARNRGTSLVPRLPVAWVVVGALAVGAAFALGRVGLIPAGAVAATAIAAAHGGLLATALAASGPRWRAPAAGLAALLAIAASLAHRHPLGAMAYLIVPVTLLALARRGPFLPGLAAPVAPRAVMLGLATGAFLGTHLLVSAARTFGYDVTITPIGPYLAAVAYDVGANVPAAECVLRGVVFENAQRRWSFTAGMALASVAAVARYLLDPSLPPSVEIVAGGVLYVTLLNTAACALFRWSGSLLPGGLASLAFFAAYRSLHPGE